jgi:hypothetical protein
VTAASVTGPFRETDLGYQLACAFGGSIGGTNGRISRRMAERTTHDRSRNAILVEIAS